MNRKAEAGKYLHGHYSALRLSLERKHRDKKRDYSETLRDYLTDVSRFYSISNFKHISTVFYDIIFYIIIKQNKKIVNTFSTK